MWIHYEWGRKTKTYQLDELHMLVLTYQIICICWLFQLAWRVQYLLSTNTPTGWVAYPLTAEQTQSIQPKKLLPLSVWWRWGLLITTGLVIILSAISRYAAR